MQVVFVVEALSVEQEVVLDVLHVQRIEAGERGGVLSLVDDRLLIVAVEEVRRIVAYEACAWCQRLGVLIVGGGGVAGSACASLLLLFLLLLCLFILKRCRTGRYIQQQQKTKRSALFCDRKQDACLFVAGDDESIAS